MDALDERFLVYTAILFLCSAIGTLTGITAAAAIFVTVAIGVEAAYWLGETLTGSGRSGATH